MFQRSWVRIPAPYTGWTFFSHVFVVKIVMFVRKDENKRKEAGDGPFFCKSYGIKPAQTEYQFFDAVSVLSLQLFLPRSCLPK